MIDRILNPGKALRTLRKTPVILRTVLSDITQTQAQILRDGPDGWNILFIVCHLRDYEQIVTQRIQLMLQHEWPVLPGMDNAALIEQHRYAEQDVHAVLEELARCRETFVHMLESLSPEQWLRSGVHPTQGPGTILDVAINAGLHDIDHIEQIVRCAPSSS